MMKITKLRVVFYGFALILLVVALWGNAWLHRPFFNGVPTTIVVNTNTTFTQMCQSISGKCSSFSLSLFKRLSVLKGYDKKIFTGLYAFTGRETFANVFSILTHGRQTPINLVIHNVRTPEELAECLGKQLMTDAKSFLEVLQDEEICAQHGFTKENIRCMFLPNTYQVYYTITPKKLLERMHVEYNAFWNEERKTKLKELGITEIDATIIASLAEEETSKKEEIETICGLYYNRVQKGMLLQSCPTIKYALKNFKIKRLLTRDLQVNSPYNTYKNIGLPPGPIRIPEGTTIDALLNHTRHGYLYMCADADRPGWNRFSKSSREHARNAAKYHAKLDKDKIK